MKKTMLGYLLLITCMLFTGTSRTFAAGGTVTIVGVKTDTMAGYDSISQIATIVPVPGSRFAPQYPKPASYIFLKIKSLGDLQYPLYIIQSNMVLNYTTVNITYSGGARYDEVKLEIRQLTGNSSSSHNQFLTNPITVRAFGKHSSDTAEDMISIHWTLH